MISIAASFLTQLAITYESIPTSTARPNIPRTEVFAPKNNRAGSDAFEVVANGGFGIKPAIFSGLWANYSTVIPALEPVCPTGNCTWPKYQSVGVCANMSDVSHLLINDTTVQNGLGRKLPNGAYLDISATGVNALNITASGELDTLAFQDVAPFHVMADIFVIIDYSVGVGNDTRAVELLLSLCRREYNTTVVNGRASTSAVIVAMTDTDPDPRPSSAYSPAWNFQNIFSGSTSDGMPTTDSAELFAQAAFQAPKYTANLLAMMTNIATSLTNT